MKSYEERIEYARAIAEEVNAQDGSAGKVWFTRNSEADPGTVRVYVTRSGHKFGWLNVPPGDVLTVDMAHCTQPESFEDVAAVFAQDAIPTAPELTRDEIADRVQDVIDRVEAPAYETHRR